MQARIHSYGETPRQVIRPKSKRLWSITSKRVLLAESVQCLVVCYWFKACRASSSLIHLHLIRPRVQCSKKTSQLYSLLKNKCNIRISRIYLTCSCRSACILKTRAINPTMRNPQYRHSSHFTKECVRALCQLSVTCLRMPISIITDSYRRRMTHT